MNVSKYLLSTLLLSIFLFVACDESEDIQRYEQEVLTTANNPLTYTNLTSYPIVGPIDSTTPNGDFDTPYRYRLLNATSSTGSSFTKASFSIEVNTGSIRYNNTANTITPGVYVLDVGVTNSNGMAVHEGAYELTILEVPIQVDIDAVQVDAGIFEQGVMATVSYTDTSASGSEVTSVSYALVEPPAGFTINATTGAISKVNGAVSGPNQLTVRVTTNTGIVIKENILTVVVGPPPTLQMVQQDDTTALTKAVVSPNTAYTTAAPVINGMSPTEWEIVFPKSLVNSDPDVSLGETVIDFSSSFGVEEPSGKISIAADSDLPSGMHTLSLKATNATASEYTFVDVLTIEVEERWETTPVYENDFSVQGTQLEIHKMGSTSNVVSLRNTHPKCDDGPVLRFGVFNPATNYNDGAAEFKIPVQGTSIKKLRISFYEIFGYNDWWVNRYKRTVSSYQSTDDTSSLDTTNWSLLEANFSSNSRFGDTFAPWSIDKYNLVNTETSTISTSTKNVSFFIRLQYVGDTLIPVGNATGGQWLLRNLKVEASKAFAAEEY